MFLRRLRGVIVSAVLWSIMWTILSLPYDAWELHRFPRWAWPHLLSFHVRHWALMGAGIGTGFAILVALLERHAAVDDLRPKQVAAWGAAGAILFLAVWLSVYLLLGVQMPDRPLMNILMYWASWAALGAISAGGVLLIARAASSARPRADGRLQT